MKIYRKIAAFLLLMGLLSSSALSSDKTASKEACTLDAPPESYEISCSLELKRENLTDEERAEAFYLRGYGRMIAEKDDAATSDVEMGLILAPDHNRLHRLRGYIAMFDGDITTALFHSLKAIELYPQGPEEHLLLGRIYLRTGQTTQAFDSLSKSIELKNDHIWSRYFRAGILIEQRKFKDALNDTKLLMSIDDKKLQKHGEVVEHHRYIALDIAVKTRHAAVLSKLGRFDESQQIANGLVTSKPSAFSFVARAKLLWTMPSGNGFPERSSQVSLDLETATKIDPEYSYAWRLLAEWQRRRRNFDASLIANENAFRTNRFRRVVPEIYWQRAKIYRLAEDYDEAVKSGITAIESAFKLPPGHVDFYISHLRSKGYWKDDSSPTELNEELIDVITACFMDPKC